MLVCSEGVDSVVISRDGKSDYCQFNYLLKIYFTESIGFRKLPREEFRTNARISKNRNIIKPEALRKPKAKTPVAVEKAQDVCILKMGR